MLPSAQMRSDGWAARAPRFAQDSENGDAAAEPALEAGAEGRGLRQLQVPVDDRDVGQEGKRVRTVDLLVDPRHGAQGRPGGAAAEENLLEGAVRGAGAGQHQARNPGDVGAGIQAQHRAAVARGVPDQAEPWLEVVEVIRDPAVGWETRIAEVGREVRILRFDQRVRIPGSLPAQTEVQDQPVGGLPGVLEVEADFLDREGLPAEVLRRYAGNGRRLQIGQYRAGDQSAFGTDSGRTAG